ncbi:MAG: thiamine-phosphate kinase [Bacteroidales bacterium]|nr:thiamine-phosphate kinase [Bacteroidales bacterium]
MAQTFTDLGRIEAIQQLFEGTGYAPFGEPLWFEANPQDCVTTASALLLEGIDFDLVYFPLRHLGRKSVLRAVGELYAVMAGPETLSVQLGISAKLDFPQVQELWWGIAATAQEHGFRHLCLDLQPSRNGLTIALSATGRHNAAVSVSRPKAQSKDLICVSGALGAAFLGLQVLERERVRFDQGARDHKELEQYKMLVGAYLRPEIDAQTARQLIQSGVTPSHGYFVTRGLADALLRLTRDSGLGAKVYADKIPFEGGSFALGKELNLDPVSAAMNGGEDYKLLYTVPIAQYERFRTDFQTFDIIGHLAQPDAGTVLVSPDGLEHRVSAQGWTPAE